MKFFTALFLFCAFATICETTPLHAQDKDKKKNKKTEESVKSGALDKAAQQKLTRLFLEAEKSKVIEDWESAIKSYLEVIVTDPTNSNAHFQLSQIYFQQGKLADAEREVLAAAKLDGTNKWYAEMLANIYMTQGKAKEAADVFKSLLNKSPNNPDYYLNLGFLQSKSGLYDAAIKTYEQFEKNFGIDENVVMQKQSLFLRLNKFNEAVAEVHKLVDAFPGEVEYMLAEAELYRANRMKEKATELYKKIIAIEPDNATALLALAELGAQTGNTQQSLESIKKIVENPKVGIDVKIKILYPYLQYWDVKKDQKQEAFDIAELMTTTHPTEAKAFAIKGDLYFLDNQQDKALESYNKALELNKDVFQVWQQVLGLYNFKRDWINLQKAATEAMEFFPNQAVIYLFKGTAEQQNKEYEKAAKSLNKGEKMSSDNAKLQAQFFANLGDLYHTMDKLAESDTAYDKSLKLDPENAYVLNNYSYYLSLRKANLEKAKQMSAYSNKLDPGNSSFLDTYAWILFQLNDFAGAKEWQEKAMKAEGGLSGTVVEHYGDILFKLGQKEEALVNWKKAKELGTDSTTIDRKIAELNYVE